METESGTVVARGRRKGDGELGLVCFLICSNVRLFLRERETDRQSVSGGGTEREADTESEAGSRLRAVTIEPDVGLEPTNREIMT